MMKRFLKLNIIGALLVAVVITTMSFVRHQEIKHIIEGTVVSEKTGKPVPRALVYTRAGEEEALTNDKGQFKIETSQDLPVTVTAEQWQHESKKVTVSDAGSKITIRLRPKS